jgi:hypothetical protein
VRLSHWDFRPKRRSRFVAVGSAAGRSGSLWKRPGLRIFVLGAFGVLVYLKYDDFVQSALLQSLNRPGELWKTGVEKVRSRIAPPPPAQYRGAYSADSLAREWSCTASEGISCISLWSGLEEEEKGRIRAMVGKARLAWGAPETSGVSALFRRFSPMSSREGSLPLESAEMSSREDGKPWRLSRIRLDWPQGGLTVAPYIHPDGTERLCRVQSGMRGDCLGIRRPRPPLKVSQSPAPSLERPPTLDFAAPAGEIVHPILPGRVAALPADSDGWLKLHHGGSLFSYYAGLEHAGTGLDVGAPVRADDTLGRARVPDSSAAAPITLRLRIERDGSPVDPVAFLGLESDSLHGR